MFHIFLVLHWFIKIMQYVLQYSSDLKKIILNNPLKLQDGLLDSDFFSSYTITVGFLYL